ncbi:MAG: aminoglycoside phosphotransferase family protein [Chloroflexota bacterium]|nr:aminoglycoside phosphotransferase family protein [Chloroflexota bacterium]
MDRVAQLLGSCYGLVVERVEPAPRGWTGETYVATTRDGARVFVKVYPKDRLPPSAAPGLPVLAELHQLGLTRVSRPILSTCGAFHERLGDDLVVVFEHLDAAPLAFQFGGNWLGDLIARVHQQTERITSPIARETLEPPYAEALWLTLARAHREPASDEPRQGLRRFLEEHATAIADDWVAFGEVARVCRAASFELVLTHGDWPFNLLQGADGTLYLIDWDELLLAPPERDTWFAAGEPAFWRSYRARRGGYAENPLAAAYYVHNRYFEELLGCAREILGDSTAEHRARALALLGSEWMVGLRARIGQARARAQGG